VCPGKLKEKAKDKSAHKEEKVKWQVALVLQKWGAPGGEPILEVYDHTEIKAPQRRSIDEQGSDHTDSDRSQNGPPKWEGTGGGERRS